MKYWAIIEIDYLGEPGTAANAIAKMPIPDEYYARHYENDETYQMGWSSGSSQGIPRRRTELGGLFETDNAGEAAAELWDMMVFLIRDNRQEHLWDVAGAVMRCAPAHQAERIYEAENPLILPHGHEPSPDRPWKEIL